MAGRAEAGVASEVVLEARGISKRFGGLVAVDDVDLAVARGAIASVIGPNGAGKTTFFNMIAGIYRPSSGEIRFNGASIIAPERWYGGGSLRPDQVTGQGIARTFQNIRLFANMSALENVLIGMHSQLRASAVGAMLRPGWVKEEERQARIKARELLDYVGLGARERHRPSQLSGGEQQRVAIARALANRPAMLLADEPTGELDARTGDDIVRLFERLNADGTTIVVVTHDETLAGATRRRIAMRDGVVVEDTGE